MNKPPHVHTKPTREEAEKAIRTLLAYTGDDPLRSGLTDTPERVVRAFAEHFKGYHEDPAHVLNTTFDEIAEYDNIILLRDIPFYSHCEHHMAPILGVAHVAYLPSDQVVGISKLARVVEIFAKRLQIQEKMTAQIAQAIDAHLKPKGVAVMIEATHHCMLGRGVNKSGTQLITVHYTGVFQTDLTKQAEIRTLFLK
ncbi:MAG: GTP cyclohydrolase I FolE [Pseudomonadota bacterium]